MIDVELSMATPPENPALANSRLAAIASAVLWCAPAAAAAECVDVARPKLAVSYSYRHTTSTGTVAQYSQRWEEASDTRSRVRVSRSGAVEIQVNEQRVVNDAVILDKTSKLTAKGSQVEATTFGPGLVLEPGSHVCSGRGWTIASVTASYRSRQINAAAASPAGALKIVAIHESITVPAGKFDTVRYTRTSQSTDEYWKSIEHGVIVKHIGRLPNAVVTEVLMAIK